MKIEKIRGKLIHMRLVKKVNHFYQTLHDFRSRQMSESKGYTYFTWNTQKECLCFVSGEKNCLTQVHHDHHNVMLIILIDDHNDVLIIGDHADC